MAISTAPSTFEYTRDWLASSECFVRDAMGATAVELDVAREQAKARIHREEALAEPNETEESETAPDLPPPVDGRPLAIVISRENRRRRNGTGNWAGNGLLFIGIEIPVPAAYRGIHGKHTPVERSERFKARKEWAKQLCLTILNELRDTSGRDDGAGNPYLNAVDINIEVEPSDPEEGEPEDYVGFAYEVEWA